MKKIFYLFLIAAIIGNGFLTTKTVSANNETYLVSDTSISEVRQVEELKVSTIKYDTDMNCMIRVSSNSDSVETTYVPIANIKNISTSDSDIQKIIPYIAETQIISNTDIKKEKVLTQGEALKIFTTFNEKGNGIITIPIDQKDDIIITKPTTTTTKKITTTTKASSTKALYSASYFKKMGVIKWGGWSWTWYSQRVLPGPGLKIPGRHVGPNGYIMDKNGRICLASTALKKGTIVDTPFGAQGCVYDSGCPKNVLDVYVDW